MSSQSDQRTGENQPAYPGTLPLLTENEGKLVLHEENLKKVLDPKLLENKSIVILSIVGAFRNGKSFFLNLIRRYFREKGWEKEKNTTWLDSWSSSNSGHIHWGPGVNGDTKGIDALKKPLIVKDPNGKEIAVILLDTEGNFQNGKKTSDNVKVFALSTLISSMTIFNVSPHIQANELECLECFVEFAKAGKNDCDSRINSADSDETEDDNIKFFQNLVFLVRDWANDFEYHYGRMGGEEYLSTVRSKSNCYQKIEKMFISGSCFLMPEPDSKIKHPNCKTPDLQSDDLGVDFKKFVMEFANDYLRPGLLPRKKIGSIESKAEELVSFIKECAKVILDENFGERANMTQLQGNFVYHEAKQKVKETYRKKLKKQVEQMDPPVWEDYDKAAKDLEGEAVKQLKKCTKFGRSTKLDGEDLRKDLQVIKAKAEIIMLKKRESWIEVFLTKWYEESMALLKKQHAEKGFWYTDLKVYGKLLQVCVQKLPNEDARDSSDITERLEKKKEKLEKEFNNIIAEIRSENIWKVMAIIAVLVLGGVVWMVAKIVTFIGTHAIDEAVRTATEKVTFPAALGAFACSGVLALAFRIFGKYMRKKKKTE